jgi:hypothetical protein
MHTIDRLLEEIYAGQERMSGDEIHRRAVAAELPSEAISILDGLPGGEYTQDEAAAALAQLERDTSGRPGPQVDDPRVDGPEGGVPASQLSDEDVDRELAQLHRTREEAFRHGSDQALNRHTERTVELEAEYLRRFPERDVDPTRLREGARARGGAASIEDTGASAPTG